jgi:phytoene dehydrogenase-like protein
MTKRIAVIGAGIAGLSAGCYARMNGFDVDVFERHSLPGGLCTSWKRGDYTFDGCIHWLTGSAEDGSFHKFWRELGALQGKTIVDHEQFFRKIFPDGTEVVFYTDAGRLEKHFLEIAPEDSKQIGRFTSLIRKFAGFRSPVDKAFELMGFFEIAGLILKMLPYGRVMKYVNETTIADFADGFSNRYLRDSFREVLYDSSMSLAAVIFTFAGLHNKTNGYPVGGSLEFSRGIEKRLLELGGKIHYKTPVTSITVTDGSAEGVVLENGERIPADYVISAIDLYTALEKLLGGRLAGSPYEWLFRQVQTFPSCVQVSLGVNMDLSGQPDVIDTSLPLPENISIAGEVHDTLHLKHYNFDPTLAPKGKSVLLVMYMGRNWEYWEKIRSDKSAYKKEKERILKETVNALEPRFPGIGGKVEQSDVATPVTFNRYTGSREGTFMTWMATPENYTEL